MDDRGVAFLTRFVEESDAIEGIANEPNSVRAQLLRAYPFGHVGALVMLHDAARMRLWQMTEVPGSIGGTSWCIHSPTAMVAAVVPWCTICTAGPDWSRSCSRMKTGTKPITRVLMSQGPA